MRQEREEVVAYSRRMLERSLTRGTGGNISILNRERGLFAITPSSVAYETMRPQDVVVLDLRGRMVEGELPASVEKDLHALLYRERSDIGAVVHTHSTYACVAACMGWELDAVHYLLGFAGGRIRLAPYYRFGTRELAQAAVEYMRDRYAVLLANHGLLCGGRDIARAFNIAEQTEFVAEIYTRCRTAGRPVFLPEGELESISELLKG